MLFLRRSSQPGILFRRFFFSFYLRGSLQDWQHAIQFSLTAAQNGRRFYGVSGHNLSTEICLQSSVFCFRHRSRRTGASARRGRSLHFLIPSLGKPYITDCRVCRRILTTSFFSRSQGAQLRNKFSVSLSLCFVFCALLTVFFLWSIVITSQRNSGSRDPESRCPNDPLLY